MARDPLPKTSPPQPPGTVEDDDQDVQALARINPAYRPRLRGVAASPRAASTAAPPQGKRSPAAGAGKALRLRTLAERLTPRDRWLLWMLLEHRVLTSGQITDLAFGTQRLATARLAVLYQLGVIDRFRPATVTGSAAYHVVLAPPGAEILATDLGATPAALDHQPQELAHLAVSLHLAHDVGANTVFTRLARHARLSGGENQLSAWWSERRCRNAWDGLVRPDGYGRWRERDTSGTATESDFFLEYDTGSENLGRVVRKLDGYAALADSSGILTPVLFWLPTPARERNLRKAIASWLRSHPAAATHLPIATSTGQGDGHIAGPADPVWLPVSPASTAGRQTVQARVRLQALAPPAETVATVRTENQGRPDSEGVPDLLERPPRHMQAPPPTPPTTPPAPAGDAGEG
jgi:hypothetical protein